MESEKAGYLVKKHNYLDLHFLEKQKVHTSINLQKFNSKWTNKRVILICLFKRIRISLIYLISVNFDEKRSEWWTQNTNVIVNIDVMSASTIGSFKICWSKIMDRKNK